MYLYNFFFFFQAEDGIRDFHVTGVQTCALPISAARSCGQDTFYYCQGIRIGMIPIMNATVVTEIEAFRILFDLRAIHIGGGGTTDSQGSVVLVAEGEKDKLDRAIALIESIKGEPSLRPQKSACTNCLPTILILTDEELPFFMKREE